MKYYLKIVSSTYSEDTHGALSFFLESIVLKIRAEKMVVIDALKPYWKIKGYGEMTVSFLSDCSKAEIESHLGNGWNDDVIDSEWAKIYCPIISFMWLTAD